MTITGADQLTQSNMTVHLASSLVYLPVALYIGKIMDMMRDHDIIFIGSSLEDLSAFPLPVKKVMGYALRMAQRGERHPGARTMVGFAGAHVIEMRDDYDGGTYRTMYTVTLGDVVYVLHAFQKKSTQGIKTPQRHIDVIKQRLTIARQVHEQRQRDKTEDKYNK